ncbi:MAG TPA: C4-type zinc ribbon domain-containing protein [Aeromicrobium sp.]|nr:C4-type zinc ribbon domain-containing protein [Aeromicrobium sp.]
MKSDPAAQQALLDVQAQDSAIARLRHRRQSLPELERIAQLQRARAELDSSRVEADTEASDLAVDQRKADAEVEAVKARRARDEERLNSGIITNPKDLESLQHELVALERRISTLEDEELEIMERLEEAQQRLAKVTADIAAIDEEIAQLESARDQAFAEIDDQLAAAEADRGLVAPNVPADLLALYDKLRESKGGVGAAALRARSCEGCRLEINGADMREIATAADDDVIRCPECGRILVRTSESGL